MISLYCGWACLLSKKTVAGLVFYRKQLKKEFVRLLSKRTDSFDFYRKQLKKVRKEERKRRNRKKLYPKIRFEQYKKRLWLHIWWACPLNRSHRTMAKHWNRVPHSQCQPTTNVLTFFGGVCKSPEQHFTSRYSVRKRMAFVPEHLEFQIKLWMKV